MTRTEYDKKNLTRGGYRGCTRQLREMKRLLEDQQSELSVIKMRELKQQKMCDDITRQLEDSQKSLVAVTEQLTAYQSAFAEITQQLATQQEIMGLFYEEYQSLKKRQGKAQLMNYIRMRDSMLKDLIGYKERSQTHTQGYHLLAMYINELTEILEDQSVEVISVSPGSVFDPMTQQPIERVEAYRPEQNNLVYKVYNCGYRWNGFMLKKADVSVCVYR